MDMDASQMASKERKITHTGYSEFNNNWSVDEPSIAHKTNVMAHQKELINKSNQKIFDLVNYAAEGDRDSASNPRCNDSLEEFN